MEASGTRGDDGRQRTPGDRLLVLVLLLVALGCRHRSDPPDAATATKPPTGASGSPIPVVGFSDDTIDLDYTASFVGSGECAACHPDEYAHRRNHHMAQTSRRVTADNRDRWFASARLAKSVRWPRSQPTSPPRYEVKDEGVFLRVTERTGETRRAEVAAVFGAGNRGFTPVSVEGDRGMRELRLSFFHGDDSWVLTPGAEGDPDPLGYIRSTESSMDCFKCHTTVLRFDADRLDLERSVFGIGCERCHGPGSAHVETVLESESSRIFNPGSLRNDRQVEFCGQCHRRPADIEPHRVFRETPDLARHAGAGIMLSACFRRSPPETTLTCVECHDPHRNIDVSRDDFNRPCLRCHSEPAGVHSSEAVTDTSNCIECHMQTETRGFFGLAFTNHWIRVPDRAPPGETPAKAEYAAYLETAYREAIARTGLGDERKSKLRMRLGKLLCRVGRQQSGLRWLRQALTFSPLYKDRILASEYHLRAGESDEAIRMLEEAVRVAPEHNRAYHALAHIHLAAGRHRAVDDVLQAWEKARPGDPVLEETRRKAEQSRRRSQPPNGR